MNKEQATYLLQRLMDGEASSSERARLSQMLQQNYPHDQWIDLLEELFHAQTEEVSYNEEEWKPVLEELMQHTRTKQRKVIPMWKRIAVAASILLMVGLGYFVISKRSEKSPANIAQTQQQRFKNDVNPGGYKARLTLADGSTIVLDSAAIGELAKQGGTVVLNKDGQLVYKTDGKVNEVLYNTLSTSRGETYTTVLADGSKVWLNSASSIKYPVAFNGNERRVEITGEAYFEVKHNDAMPFIVSVNGMEVHDLGTEFNINAYDNEAGIKTTLVEGSASVVNGSKKQLLAPGQQAQLNNGSSEIKLINNADVMAATAWKNGRFYFDGTDIKTVMRQLERWYNVEVEFRADIPYSFVAKISRDVPVSETLKLLEMTGGVRFVIEGKKVIVMK